MCQKVSKHLIVDVDFPRTIHVERKFRTLNETTRGLTEKLELKMSGKRLLKGKEVAAMLGVAESTIRYWRHVGLGPQWFKLEGAIRYDLVEVHKYLERNCRIPSVRSNVEEKRVSL